MTSPIAATTAGSTTESRDAHRHGGSFHEVLSALNPLQYLPVVGTIYRAVTGDTIPEPVRRIGSMIVSGLLGGPIGVAINVASLAAEKASGIDLDGAGQALVRGEPLGPALHAHAAPTAAPEAPQGGVTAAASGRTAVDPTPTPTVAASSPATDPATTAPAPATTWTEPPREPWSADQLAAYGVTTTPSGGLRMAGLDGAEVLNALELSRVQVANAAYARAVAAAA